MCHNAGMTAPDESNESSADSRGMKAAARGSWNWGVLGGYIGTLIGALGWVIGFAVVCLATGNTDTLARIIAPATAVSLGLAFFVILCSDMAIKKYGAGPMFFLALYGGLAWAMGLLLLLFNHWIAVIINESPRMMRTMQNMNAVYQTDDLWAVILLVAGTVLLGIFTVLVLKDSARN